MSERNYWSEQDPDCPLFRRCGCPIDETCRGHPDDDDDWIDDSSEAIEERLAEFENEFARETDPAVLAILDEEFAKEDEERQQERRERDDDTSGTQSEAKLLRKAPENTSPTPLHDRHRKVDSGLCLFQHGHTTLRSRMTVGIGIDETKHANQSLHRRDALLCCQQELPAGIL